MRGNGKKKRKGEGNPAFDNGYLCNRSGGGGGEEKKKGKRDDGFVATFPILR